MAAHPRNFKPITFFVAHVFAGTVMFLILGSVAIGIALLVQSLESLHLPDFTVRTLTLIEHIILVADGVIYLTYIASAGWNALKEMFK